MTRDRDVHEQHCTADDGTRLVKRERRSRRLAKAVVTGSHAAAGDGTPPWQDWENDVYYGSLRRHDTGSPLGGGPYAVIGISSKDETARHDFRDYQQIKNDLVGEEWEGVELYPAESRLVDPSNRFYLFCFPKGVIPWGFVERHVVGPEKAVAPQRAFPLGGGALTRPGGGG